MNVIPVRLYFIQVGMALVVTLVSVGLSAMDFNSRDYEIWNGEVSSKTPIQKSCPNGWVTSKDDFCTEYRTSQRKTGESCSTDAKGKRSCYPVYETIYRYYFDWERRYFVFAKNISAEWEIERVDQQGVRMPPRFNEAQIGDPASKTNLYYNWVAAASDSIFNEDGAAEEKYKGMIPEYPINVYDYYKVDRIVPVGVAVENLPALNKQLSEALKELGPKKQMNALFVVVDATKVGTDYPYAVRRAWRGFKKNDAVVFVGVNAGNVEWTDIMSWSKASIFDVEMREKILANVGKPLDVSNYILYLKEVGLSSYERRSMKEFEFLRDEIPTPVWIIALQVFLLIVAVIGSIIVASKIKAPRYRM